MQLTMCHKAMHCDVDGDWRTGNIVVHTLRLALYKIRQEVNRFSRVKFS